WAASDSFINAYVIKGHSLVKLPTRRERAFPRVVKERHWKYPTALKKSQSVA
ncbi:hypothetical protein ACLLKP_004221, partial [Shigella flexneri]